MKKSILFIFMVLGHLSTSAQEIIWLDVNLDKTSKEKASFYKVGEKTDGEVLFYFKQRTVFRVVYFSKGKPNGKFSEFYETGELKETGFYINGLREGIWKEFYRGGKIKSKGKYSKGDKVGIWKLHFKNDR